MSIKPSAAEALDRIIDNAKARKAEYIHVGVDAQTETVCVGATTWWPDDASWDEVIVLGATWEEEARTNLLQAAADVVRALWSHVDDPADLWPDGRLVIKLPPAQDDLDDADHGSWHVGRDDFLD